MRGRRAYPTVITCRSRLAARGRTVPARPAACAPYPPDTAGGQRRCWQRADFLAAVTVAAGSGPAALAATAGPSCASGVCSVTFATPGIGQSFTVPAGVPSLSLTLYGAVGGENDTSDVAGGDGAKLTADLALNPGDGINIDVGGAGGTPALPNPDALGGVNGGGYSYGGGGGGGATDVTDSGRAGVRPDRRRRWRRRSG